MAQAEASHFDGGSAAEGTRFLSPTPWDLGVPLDQHCLVGSQGALLATAK